MSLYNNKMYEVTIGKSQEKDKDYNVYLCTNIETQVVEFEGTMLIELLEAADFFKEKMEAREQGKVVGDGANVVGINETLATH